MDEWGAATIASKIRETVERSGKDAPIYLRYGPANPRKEFFIQCALDFTSIDIDVLGKVRSLSLKLSLTNS
jgi:hypothetical protein